ncbi:ubiquinone anaerobic biosynthesis accessory factor UbiT [Novilysobacter spongiicola]|uniref:Ubiquinone biosynthesis accessory factor UbiT n=1 Tax=Lysobacter spongiicola DSM 21749 TaxID=1122188 RepID=A0A1T4QKU5_9GAMM|nr:chorismate mutase [Lysobacter spongiicola]SKA04410.1 Predicted lipid carrier protein YhbT, contains SCP2 domain [Lysobacter spongiicola DSM 21749]
MVPIATLGGVRRGIDVVDDALLVLVAARARLAATAGRLKCQRGVPVRDAQREGAVHSRGQRLAARLGVPRETTRALMDLVIRDAHRAQRGWDDLGQGDVLAGTGIVPAMTTSAHVSFRPAARLLALVPPPSRLAPLLRRLPQRTRARLLERAMGRVLAVPMAGPDLDFMRDRRLGVEVTDLGLSWVVQRQGDVLRVTTDLAEATVRGTATDLLLLASRLEDADTLFFQRRLVLTGDVELGLTVRNLLERLPWESVPLGLRIGLNRGARLARAARAAHRGATADMTSDRG